MKKLMLITILCLAMSAIFAQENTKLKLPAASPEAAFTQQIGTAEFKVAYARPLVRGRKIFGALVPFDSIWRTGASDCTTFSFNEEMTFGDKKFKAGKYALFTIPKATGDWTVIVNTDTTLHGTIGYDASKDIYRFTVKSQKTERFYETFTLEVNDITPRSEGSLNLMWENTRVKIPIKSAADENIALEINKRLVENKEQNADLMFQAASYYYSTNQNLRQASDWVLAAEKLDNTNLAYPNLNQKILADLKEYRPAIDAAQRAIVLAEKKNSTSTVTTLKKRIAEWQTILGEKPTPVAVETPVTKTGTMPEKPENHAGHDMSGMNMKNSEAHDMSSMKKTDAISAPDLKAQFAPVLAAYFGLKDALVADNANLAATKGKALYKALQNLETKTWTIKQRNTYDDVAKKLETDAEHISENADKIDHQREHFESLSSNLSVLTKALKINAETVYFQYCPMKKAWWMSNDKAIKNPYYGSQMLTCGSVKEVLK